MNIENNSHIHNMLKNKLSERVTVKYSCRECGDTMFEPINGFQCHLCLKDRLCKRCSENILIGYSYYVCQSCVLQIHLIKYTGINDSEERKANRPRKRNKDFCFKCLKPVILNDKGLIDFHSNDRDEYCAGSLTMGQTTRLDIDTDRVIKRKGWF